MSAQRALAAVFFSVVIVVVLAAIIYTDHVSTSNTVNVYILDKDVPAGQIAALGDFTQHSVHADEGEFATAAQQDIGELVGHSRYLINLHVHDILRTDDLTGADTAAEVPVVLNAAGSGVFTVGDRIDIYAFFNGQSIRVSGQGGVTVMSASNNIVVVTVPVADEAYWVTLAFAKPDMLATRAGANLAAAQDPISETDALRALSGNTAIGAGTTAPAPKP